MAPDNAVPLTEVTSQAPDWVWACPCGARGKAHELLVDPEGENTTIWCPVCRCATWVWA